MAQPTAHPTNHQGRQTRSPHSLRRTVAGLVAAAALWLSAAGTAFADHHAGVDFHSGRPGHEHGVDFHSGRPGHEHGVDFHGMA